MASRLKIECAVIGGGAVGLAVTRALALRGVEVVCLEKASRFGEGISSRNSEVVHAGLYYDGSRLPRKRRCCVRGRELLYEYCEARGVPYLKCGKLIVASSEAQLDGLEALEALAAAAGVADVSRMGRAQVRALEPEVECVGALRSPSTGIFESARFVDALVEDCERSGAILATDHAVLGRTADGALAVAVGDSDDVFERFEVDAGRVVNSCGLEACLVARALGAPREATPTLLARGSYFALRGESPFRQLVYPLPDPRGGLGVHATIDMAGRARFGPDVEWLPPDAKPTDPKLFDVDPSRAEPFYRAIRSYYPALKDGDLLPDYAGVRPKLDAAETADFTFLAHDNVLHLLGIESPGLTSALALAEEAADALLERPRPGGAR